MNLRDDLRHGLYRQDSPYARFQKLTSPRFRGTWKDRSQYTYLYFHANSVSVCVPECHRSCLILSLCTIALFEHESLRQDLKLRGED